MRLQAHSWQQETGLYHCQLIGATTDQQAKTLPISCVDEDTIKVAWKKAISYLVFHVLHGGSCKDVMVLY